MTIASRYLISVNVDHNASDNFYQTEGILEEVKTGLLEYAGDAGEEAYKDVVEHYTKTKDSMHKTFSEKYISLLASKLMGYSYAWDESKVGTEQNCDLSILKKLSKVPDAVTTQLGGALLDASGVPLLLTVCTIVSAVGAAIVWCAVQTKKHAAC